MIENNMTHRQLVFDEKIDSPYLWCLHCERTYNRGEYRIIKIHGEEYQMCPYEGCDGDTIGDGWSWTQIQINNPFYPSIPIRNIYYPMYPKPRKHNKNNSEYFWCSVCYRVTTQNKIKKKRYISKCTYEDCLSNNKKSDTLCIHHAWELLRDFNPDYPEIPESNKIYVPRDKY